MGSVVAAAAGAAVVATAVAGRRRRRRREAISPENALAGPPIDKVRAPEDRATPAGVVAPPDEVAVTVEVGADDGALVEAVGPATEIAAEAAEIVEAPRVEHSPVETRLAGRVNPADLLEPPLFVGRTSTGSGTADRLPPSTPPAPGPTAAPPEPPVLVAAPRRHRSLRPIVGVAVAVAVALVLGAGAVVAGSAGDDRPARGESAASADDPDRDTAPSTTTTTLPRVTAADAFGVAGRRLADAGSFSYSGNVSATDVSHVRPMLWLAVESTVEGQVSTATGRLHEIATASDGASAETVTEGRNVWGRRAPVVNDLVDESYESIPALSSIDGSPAARGAALLPTWLTSAVDPAEAAADAQGRRTFRATIPAEVLGEIEREREPVGATIVLTIDDDGDPVRVEITSAPDGPALHLVFEISAVGASVGIEVPT